jgi:hypothetical protein
MGGEMRVAIEVHRADEPLLEEIQNAEPGSFETISAHRFGGEIGVTAALVSLTATTIPVLAGIIKELIRSRKYVKLKVRGIEVAGVSEDTILEILERLKSDELKKTRKP